MPWGRLEDDLHDNEKVWSFTHQEFRVWMYSISFCNAKRTKEPDTYDVLSGEAARGLCRIAKVGPAVIAGLVDKRGWDAVGGDRYRVHDLTSYGPKLDWTAAERQARHRSKASGHATSNGTSHAPVTRAVTHPVPDPVPVPSPLVVTSSVDPLKETDTEGNTHNGAAAAVPALPAPKRLARPTYSEDFEAWWREYPRHDAKYPSKQSYDVRRKAGRSAEALLAAARHLAAYVDEHGTPTDKIPHATTFLNQRRDEGWEHGPPDAGRKSRGRDEPRGFQGIREAFSDLAREEA